MKRTLYTFVIAAFFASCAQLPKEPETMAEQNEQPENTSAPADTTPKVTGIGGIFFYSDDPKQTRNWYAENLGIEVNDWGGVIFESKDMEKPEVVNSLVWTPFKTGNEHFAPSKKEFMINYRVQNLEGLVKKLEANGVTILDTMVADDFGKFIHIMDAEGNKIELWEPS